MIARLSGEIVEKLVDQVILEVNGVGYELYINDSEQNQLTVGEQAKLYVHEQLREDAYDLYGFTSQQSKNLFEQLISVKNIGPKVGLSLMSIGSPEMLRNAIAAGDIRVLMSAKGVGKRAAEQLVVELRDKLGLVSASGAEAVVGRSGINPNDEALQALLALGFNEHDALSSLKSVDSKLAVSERVKLALREAKHD